MRTYGIAYCVRQVSDEEFAISFGYSYSDGNNGFIRRPRTGRFSWPIVDVHVFHKFSASQIQGLVGGVEDAWQRARSDSLERAVGDTLTVSVCEILDSRTTGCGPWVIYILGPALNKTVGRLASLRPPEEVKICWICPVPFPPWISATANEPVLLPSYDPNTGITWKDEPLVATSEIGRGTPSACVIQVLRMWLPEAASPDQGFSVGVKLWNASLPREVVVAAGQVDLHANSPYSDLPLLAQLRPLVGEFAVHQNLYVESREGCEPLPGWSIAWSSAVS